MFGKNSDLTTDHFNFLHSIDLTFIKMSVSPQLPQAVSHLYTLWECLTSNLSLGKGWKGGFSLLLKSLVGKGGGGGSLRRCSLVGGNIFRKFSHRGGGGHSLMNHAFVGGYILLKNSISLGGAEAIFPTIFFRWSGAFSFFI